MRLYIVDKRIKTYPCCDQPMVLGLLQRVRSTTAFEAFSIFSSSRNFALVGSCIARFGTLPNEDKSLEFL
ncbi:hypothetical protein CDL12_08005 [Handroanthus impetiginosus]|uniref:Uncharacterized protein n=1 Tax=Handroanthus impetiginosus TaxID=429701 RepID=A0A2G9HP63_9LAMI|nr:hypothetical protein CDL12_08005 [Handroanthus impetiginosus]